MPCLERNASSYPPSIQVTLASALAQLDEYSESEAELWGVMLRGRRGGACKRWAVRRVWWGWQ